MIFYSEYKIKKNVGKIFHNLENINIILTIELNPIFLSENFYSINFVLPKLFISHFSMRKAFLIFFK